MYVIMYEFVQYWWQINSGSFSSTMMYLFFLCFFSLFPFQFSLYNIVHCTKVTHILSYFSLLVLLADILQLSVIIFLCKFFKCTFVQLGYIGSPYIRYRLSFDDSATFLFIEHPATHFSVNAWISPQFN